MLSLDTAKRFHAKMFQDFVLVPGILMHPDLVLAPIRDVIADKGYEIRTIHYNLPFVPDESIDQIVTLVGHAIKCQRPLTIFGTSLGGMLTAKALGIAVEKWGTEEMNKWVTTIIVDSPSRREDLIIAPFLPGWFNRVIGGIFNITHPRANADTGYGKWLLERFRVPPKDDAIEIPELERVGQSLKVVESADAYRANIKQRAIEQLSGHSYTLWHQQLNWMLHIKKLPLEKLAGLNVTYIACMQANVTVRQPQALYEWAPYCQFKEAAPTAHCAFLEAQITWSRLLCELLNRVVPIH